MTVNIKRLNASRSDFDSALAKLLAWDDSVDHQVNESVRHILHEVKTRGDQAVLEFTEKFDRLKVSSVAELEMDQSRLQQALEAIPRDQREALEKAAERIRDYHERQNQKSWQYEDEDGTVLGQKVTPLDRAGLYVPVGKAAYPFRHRMVWSTTWSWPPQRLPVLTGSSPLAAPRPLARWPMAQKRSLPLIKSSAQATFSSPPPSAKSSALSAST